LKQGVEKYKFEALGKDRTGEVEESQNHFSYQALRMAFQSSNIEKENWRNLFVCRFQRLEQSKY